MAQDGNIGAARISLVVDADNYESTLNRLKNTAADFGNAAEAAFERSSGKARTAANRLLDYVATLGRAESQLERMVRQASRAGVEAPVIAAAVREYKRYEEQLKATADQQKRTNDEMARVAGVDNLRGQLQEKIGGSFGGLNEFDLLERQASKLGASEALAPYIAQLRQLDAEQKQAAASARLLATAFDEATRENREFDLQLERTAQDAAAINARIDSIRNNLQEKIGAARGVSDPYDGLEREAQRLGAGNTLGPYIAKLRQVEQETRDAVAATQALAAAENAAETEAREIHRQWVAIEKQVVATTQKLSSYDIARNDAVQRYGAAGAAPLVKQINQLEKLNTTIHGTTVNTKQLQQAIRFLPAQFTDIGVSLAGGMNPLLVAFQQGGQILDQFRLAGATTGDTFRMIGTYAMRLVNPVTVGTAALAAFAYAGYDAAKSMEELAIASAKGYGQAGNAEQLYAVAEALNRMENVRLGPAEQAVARLAATGRLAGENFEMAAEATARWSSLTGEAADRVAGQFEAIAKDPLQAIESGLVRVTQAQYEHVRALVNQGQQQEAVNTLTKIFYDTINNNSANVEAHLSGVSRYIHAIKDGFGEATRAAGEYFNGIFGWMADYEATYQRMVKEGGNPFVAQFRAWNTDPKAKPDFSNVSSDPLADPAAAARAKSQADDLATYLATADERAQRQITLNRIVENGKRLGVDVNTTAQIIARQEKLWAEQDAKRNKSSRGGTGARTAARDVRYDYQLESALLQTQTREVQAAYAVREVTAEAYYASLIKFAQQEFDIQKRSNAEQLAAIGGKKGQEHEVARLRVADAIAEQQLAQRTIDIQSQQAQYTEQLTREREAYTNSLRDSVQAQQEEFQVALNRLTMGGKEFERWNAENELRREGIRLWEEATRWAKENPNQVEEGQRRVQAAIQATNDKLNQTAAAYANIDAAQADWANGASKAWKNWRDDVSDVSAHAEKVTTESLDTIADLTTDALTGNLKSWGDYFDGIAYMITQFIVKQQLTKWIESIGQSSGGGGFWDKAAGFVAGLLGGGGGFQASSNGVSGQQFADVFSDGGAFGFAKGGFTGHGADSDIAGLVHKNEYVVPAPVVRAIRSGRPMAAGDSGVAGGRTLIVHQHNKFDMASDKTSRDQARRDQSDALQKAVNKV